MADYTVQDLQDNLDYLNNTKQIIKQSIINKGQSISDTDTFRSYADKISAIETGKGDVKLFETEEAMQADTKAEEGDLAVVYKNEINIDTFKGLYEYYSNYKDTNSIQLVNISNTEITEYSENFSFNWNNSFGTVIDLSKLKKCLDKMNEDLSKSNFYIFVKDNEIYASPYDETSNNISNVYILNTGEIIGLGPNLSAYKDLSTLPSVQMYKLNLDTSTYTLYQTINVSQTTYKRDDTYYFYYYPFIPDTFCLYGYNNLTNELNYCLIFPNNDGTYKLIPSNINVNMDKSYLVSSKYILAPTQLTLAASNELLSGKIAYGKNGVVTGTLEPGLDTSDATATSDDILYPKTAYVKGQKITGGIEATYNVLSNVEGNLGKDPIEFMKYIGNKYVLKIMNGGFRVYEITDDNTLSHLDNETLPTNAQYNNFTVSGITEDNDFRIIFTDKRKTNNLYYYRFSIATKKIVNVGTFKVFNDSLHINDGFKIAISKNGTRIVEYITQAISNDTEIQLGNVSTTNITSNRKLYSATYGRECRAIQFLNNDKLINVSFRVLNSQTQIENYQFILDDVYNYSTKYNIRYDYTNLVFNSNFTYCYNDNAIYTVKYENNMYKPDTKVVDTDSSAYTFKGFVSSDYVAFNETLYKIANSLQQIQVYNRAIDTGVIDTAYAGIDLTNSVYYYTIVLDIDNQIVNIIESLDTKDGVCWNLSDVGTTEDKVLSGYKYGNYNGIRTGTMPNNGTLNYTPNTTQQTIPAGYTSGGTVAGDSNLIPENIKKDVSIFNVVGTMFGDTATYNYETTDYTISHIDSTDAVTYMDVLQDYALVEFTGPRVDLYHKVDNTWTLLKNITTKSIEAADGSQDSISKGTSRIIKVENNIVYTYTGVIDTAAKIIGYIFTYNINTQELDKHVIENTTSDSVGTMDIMTYNSNYMITGLSKNTVAWYSIDFDNYTITEIDEDYSGRGNTAIKNNVWLSTLYYRTGYIFNTASGTAQEFGDINMDGSIAAILFDETKVIKNDGNVYEINVEWQIGNKVGESNYLDIFTNNEKLYCINSKYYRYEDSLYELTVTDTTYTFTLVTTNTNIDRCNNTIYLTTPVGDTAINDFYEFIPGTIIVSMNYNGDVWYNHPIYNGATSDKVLSGNYTYDQNHNVVQGTMPNKGDLTVTPSLSDQNFGEGYYSSITVNEVTSAIDSDIKPENIKDGVNILGVVGTLETGLDTSDATATAEDIAEDKTAYVKGQKITGSVMTTAKGASPAWQTHDIVSNSGNGALYASTIISNGDKPRLYQGSNKLSLTLSWEDVSNVIGLTPEKLVAGNTIIGVEGTATSLDTSDATATAEDIAEDKTAYVKGQKITGTIPTAKYGASSAWSTNEVTKRDAASALDLATYISVNNPEQPVLFKGNNKLTLSAGYEKVAEVIGLTAEKIKSGETILGVEGTYEGNAGDDVSNYISSEKGVGITNGRLTDYIVQIPLIDTSEAVSMNNMFQYFNMLKTIPLIDTSKVTTMTSMFSNCTNLQTISLIDTSEVTSMTNMFEHCYSLQTIPLLNTSKVTSMGNMFYHCEALTSIPQIDTSKVTSMGSMFAYCSSLQTVPVLDLSSATGMYKVFNYCEALSNDSLNNILASLLTATSYKGTKALNYIGLSETQATTCTTLSNWAACEEAGWTTGY